MIAAEVAVWKGEGRDCPVFDKPILVELTDWSLPFVELAFDINSSQRVYLKFRLSDLQREIKEA